jgi:predicted dehydrogenase
MTLTIAEGRELADAVRRYGTVFQCSHQRRSVDSYKFIVEVVHSGLIGELHTITTSLFGGHQRPVARPRPTPPGWGDFDRWLGPAPEAAFSNEILGAWGSNWDYAGGAVTGMGTHLVDIAQWGNQTELSAPVEYEPGDVLWPTEGFGNTPIKSAVYCRYANGVKLDIVSGETGDFNADRWTKFEGTEGWVCQYDYDSTVEAEPKSILKTRGVDRELWANNANHFQNWLDCIKTGAQTACPAEISHRSTTVCHVANISLRLGRPVRWNPETEQFVDDPEANSMISRPMRVPWHT